MLPSLILHILLSYSKSILEQKEAAAKEACKDYRTVELVPADMEARKIKPKNSIVASQMRADNLVPVKSFVIFMKADSENPLSGTPENVLLLNKKFVESIGNVPHQGNDYVLMKGVLGDIIADPVDKEAEEEEGAEEDMGEPEGGEPEAEEGAEYLKKTKK